MVVVARTSHAEKVRATVLMTMNAIPDMSAANKAAQKEKALIPEQTVVSWLVVHINSVSLSLQSVYFIFYFEWFNTFCFILSPIRN